MLNAMSDYTVRATAFDYQASEQEANLIAAKYSKSGNVLANMSRDFGQDLSGVRVHTNMQAQLKAEQEQSAAYTKGKDIYMGSGYEPGTPSGNALLAHEAAHTLQQSGNSAMQAPAPAGTVQRAPEDELTPEQLQALRDQMYNSKQIHLRADGPETSAIIKHHKQKGMWRPEVMQKWQTKFRNMDVNQFFQGYNRRQFGQGGLRTTTKSKELMLEYLDDLSKELDENENMKDFVRSGFSVAGGDYYSNTKKNTPNAFDGVTNHGITPLWTRGLGFSTIAPDTMRQQGPQGNAETRNQTVQQIMDSIICSLENMRKQSGETGDMPEGFEDLQDIRDKYMEIYGKFQNIGLPMIRDDSLHKLTPEEFKKARPNQQPNQQPNQPNMRRRFSGQLGNLTDKLTGRGTTGPKNSQTFNSMKLAYQNSLQSMNGLGGNGTGNPEELRAAAYNYLQNHKGRRHSKKGKERTRAAREMLRIADQMQEHLQYY
jgi:hypothetical protein